MTVNNFFEKGTWTGSRDPLIFGVHVTRERRDPYKISDKVAWRKSRDLYNSLGGHALSEALLVY